jgi:hypothetical protein
MSFPGICRRVRRAWHRERISLRADVASLLGRGEYVSLAGLRDALRRMHRSYPGMLDAPPIDERTQVAFRGRWWRRELRHRARTT